MICPGLQSESTPCRSDATPGSGHVRSSEDHLIWPASMSLGMGVRCLTGFAGPRRTTGRQRRHQSVFGICLESSKVPEGVSRKPTVFVGE